MTIARNVAADMARQRSLLRAVETCDVVTWTCDEQDLLTSIEGGASPVGHVGQLVGRHMRECPYSAAYFAAKEVLDADPERRSVGIKWELAGRTWTGTFSRLLTAGGRAAGIAAVAMPSTDALDLGSVLI